MSLDEADRLIATWDERVKLVDDNLIVLEGDASFQLLSAAHKRGTLTGVTAERVGPALDAVAALFEEREQIAAIVARAKAVRESVSSLAFWERDEKARTISDLFLKPSIVVDQTHTPLAERKLLGGPEHEVLVEPERMLAHMTQAFDFARDVVAAVAKAWEQLEQETAALDAEIAGLEGTAAVVGHELPEVAAARRDAAAARDRIATDPLGVEHAFASTIRPRIAEARARVDAELQARARVEAGLVRAKDLRTSIDRDNAASSKRVAEAAALVEEAGHLPPPLDPSVVEGLDPWLTKLRSTADAGRHAAADVGLGRWFEAAEAYLAQARQLGKAASALLEQRIELQGRLSARTAQLAALRARGAAGDPWLERRIHEAQGAVDHEPMVLADAARLVDAIDLALAELRRSS